MAQDPERDEAPQDENALDTSPDFDMVTLYSASSMDAEMETEVIRGLLESNGVPSVQVRTEFPPLGYEVKVPRSRVEEAQLLLKEAKAAGPDAAAEAEAASEEV